MRHGKTRFVMGFLALPLALYVWYVVWPFAQSIGYSFTDWGGYSDEQHYIGFANYVRLFNDELIRIAFWHNVFFLITVPLITIGLALFFAFLLNVGGRGNRAGIRGVWGSGVYKIIFFFPQVLSLVLIAVMWQAIYRGDDQGLLNGLLIKTGLVDKDHPLGFVADPTPFLGVPAVLWWILFIAVWGGVGFYLVLFSAAMQSIPRDIYEAALLDGASRSATFFRITLPLLWDTVQSGWVYMGILALGAESFAVVQIMTTGPGGPDYSTTVMVLYVYQKAFRDGQAAYATTIGVALLIVTLAFAAIVMRLGRRERLEY